MKKRSLFIIITVILAAVLFAVVFPLLFNSVSYEGAFDFEEYRLTAEHNPSDMKTREITDTNTAAEEANKLWEAVYGRKYHGRIAVSRDGENSCWLVSATLPTLSFSDFPYFPAVLILDDGTVLSVWLEQF